MSGSLRASPRWRDAAVGCCRADRPSAHRAASVGPLAAPPDVRPTGRLLRSYGHAVRCIRTLSPEAEMTTAKRLPERAASRRGKVRKEFWLDPKALRRAQSVLGTSTERETVERAGSRGLWCRRPGGCHGPRWTGAGSARVACASTSWMRTATSTPVATRGRISRSGSSSRGRRRVSTSAVWWQKSCGAAHARHATTEPWRIACSGRSRAMSGF